jgi:hypothetical protein
MIDSCPTGCYNIFKPFPAQKQRGTALILVCVQIASFLQKSATQIESQKATAISWPSGSTHVWYRGQSMLGHTLSAVICGSRGWLPRMLGRMNSETSESRVNSRSIAPRSRSFAKFAIDAVRAEFSLLSKMKKKQMLTRDRY